MSSTPAQQKTNVDRPRTGANQTGAGSPVTQQGAQEMNSMADVGQGGQEWGPLVGKLELAPERAELIRGLYQLAAWVADRPELPLPEVEARVHPSRAWHYSEDPSFEDECGVVDRVAAALGVPAVPEFDHGHYTVRASLGPVEVVSAAVTAQRLAVLDAVFSYRDNLQVDADQTAAGGE